METLKYIEPGARVTRAYAERLLKDVRAESFARLPVVGGVRLSINHPAFVFGHLSIYPIQLVQMAGLPAEGLEVPKPYEELFTMGAACQDDPDRAIYPTMDELTSRFFAGYDQLLIRLRDLIPEVLEKPLENPSRRERFGTVGAFITYILLAHPQSHLGQVSAWRRCMGLVPA